MTREDRNIWNGITCEDALAERAWLAALGFDEGICVAGEAEGTVMHSEMLWPEGGRVMVHSAGGKADDTFAVAVGGASSYVVSADPDAVHARAVELGAPFVREMEETDYGSRGFSVKDHEGNRWSFGTYAGAE
ncbi:glyoxalase [Nocardioides mangrovicus]|uniref:Glyoxalase n=1 Tax=Nocardioides mangrovicus TaxID=2478913 RepID=A0A3L8P2I5_9ACTN|nr:VOC family protein [Nocardioides mangrovicus]RLV49271.1 glyoxalase [Nocardioides mangrovicus]